MEDHIGLDVSMKETAVSIRPDGQGVWRGKCVSDLKVIAEVVRKRAPLVERVVLEAGPMLVLCIDARHAKAALDMAPYKTDANDADGLAHLAEVEFYREVRVKEFGSMLTRTHKAARRRLDHIATERSNKSAAQ